MLEAHIPGSETLQLSHLVVDFNGTLARDGQLLAGVAEKLTALARLVQVHVITADIHGTAAERLAGLPCLVHVIGAEGQDRQKDAYVRSLGATQVAAIGNGRNDRLMLHTAALGIAVIQEEGASVEAVLQADIVCTDILHALALLVKPNRLKATLCN